ncbi:PKD domain-containing protein [Methanofollis aquaemaris]|uniref:PKD domain-containing protein n=1 Tax=Methanofollis aquaemaris TaxID=126734 RepID=UPI0037426513
MLFFRGERRLRRPSTDQNPTHRYVDEGTYTIGPTVSNTYGSLTAEQTVTASHTPSPIVAVRPPLPGRQVRS